MNLLTNSCKFTFQGSITVSINVFSNDDSDYVKFCVSDTGIGIKKEDQSKLFRLFGMIKSSNEGQINPNGCGIGLTVSKKYIEYMGGTIQLESELGEGTSVAVLIPVNKAETITIVDSHLQDMSFTIENLDQSRRRSLALEMDINETSIRNMISMYSNLSDDTVTKNRFENLHSFMSLK